jgi:threonine aldolase
MNRPNSKSSPSGSRHGHTATFVSDNFATVDPMVMAYLVDINRGHTPSYGNDAITRQAEELVQKVFGSNAQVLFVPSGTGANMLGLKLLLARPYEAIVTTESSHVFGEETGAAAANLGAHIYTVPQHDGKVYLNELQRVVDTWIAEGFHAPLPKVVSIANATEFGTVYTPDEVRGIAEYCHEHDMYLYMDGCRLANAAVSLGMELDELTAKTGVDVLSFGGAKNGLMSAEAVVVFNSPDTDLQRIQKQALQLVSKMRFVSGQFVPYLQDERWRKNAATANRLARMLADGLGEGISRPVETNQVFCRLPVEIVERIRAAGHDTYNWPTGEVRFVASWDNTEADVKTLLELTA